MYSSPEEIKAAVDAYRARIASHNRDTIEVVVPFVAAAQLEQESDLDSDDDGEDMNDLRVDSLASLLNDRIAPYVSSPNDVLTRYEELVPILGLDGVGTHEPDLLTDPDYVLQRDTYFSHLERALKQKCLPEVCDIIAVPEEFRTLAEHALVLTGPGLTEGSKSHQAMFWVGVLDEADDVAELVLAPEGMRPLDGWECAAAWQPGGGFECPFNVVFCRRRGEEAGGRPQPWVWRYMVSSMDERTAVFDTNYS
ncbi:hypothetical protein INS49_015867 [Diaporthe citri]|uniref:uncharacterized protein n=1 Tax=Diaporthe citri TaxID=83186 RepID=UPI001C7E9D00|nr:uncharacterized protein INS49_015867 [Diaporthe citri]KAG6356479.1 hypothetical protein INS49_015867 [Diaporthe citri]